MSKIALTPNATGTGVFTISSPATNTDRTLTLPDEAGSIVVNTATGIDVTGTVTATEFNIAEFSTSTNVLQSNTGETGARLRASVSSAGFPTFAFSDDNNTGIFRPAADTLGFGTAGTERLRIDSSGNVLVGKTAVDFSVDGVALQPSGVVGITRDGGVPLILNRKTSDGDIVNFQKSGVVVGGIGNDSNNLYMVFSIGNNIGLAGGGAVGGNIFPTGNNGFVRDNGVDLGYFAGRYKTVYATTGSINTSDRTEKQDIDAMSEAETRVAVACKGLMRKFRWKDAVAEKGDDARIHFGIIAQDLQDAFAAEGLDAGRYAMFCSNTWWETQTHVPAVEAVVEVLDEEGNVVTGAVEAKETYIRTDHYGTLEKAPEGATERTRLGVRYSELLAFIIGAL
jgi:hypothetical protein